jgi:phenylalanyl-tRNA synthetase beta chain
MKFTWQWLGDHLLTEASLPEVAEVLGRLGFQVESIWDPRKVLADFCVGDVVEVSPHPKADRLQLCKIKTTQGLHSVICGAENVLPGLRVVFAPLGSIIPQGGMEICPVKIRGVKSVGMLCSYRELGLDPNDFVPQEEAEKKHIIELPQETDLETPVAEALGLDDPVIDIEVTSNRGDMMGVYGIARELSAAGLGELQLFKQPLPLLQHVDGFPELIVVKEAAHFCPSICFAFLSGVCVSSQESLDMFQKRLRAVGVSLQSLPVDVTNYITYDIGRPLHAFDADRIQGNIVLRLAEEEERFEALNGTTYSLKAGDLVFSDDVGVLSLAGVMGGKRSAVSEDTRRIVLESACFEPRKISKAARRLGLVTDSSLRFERGVDLAMVRSGLGEAIMMMQRFCGAKLEGGVALHPEEEPPAAHHVFDPALVEKLSSVHVSIPLITQILEKLGFHPHERDGHIALSVPPWRHDIEGQADFVEEILRHIGYDGIRAIPLGKQKPTLTTSPFALSHKMRLLLAGRGLTEVITWSFVPRDMANIGVDESQLLEITNPISQDMAFMRTSLFPGLLGVMKEHRSHKRSTGLGIFEVGIVYHGTDPEDQMTVLGGVMREPSLPAWRMPPPVNWETAKAHVLALWSGLGGQVSDLTFEPLEDSPFYHPGRAGVVRVEGQVIASFGELHPVLLEQFCLCRDAVCGFEIPLQVWEEKRPLCSVEKGYVRSSFQPIMRDIALLVDESVLAGDVVQAIRQAGGTDLTQVILFDVFEDEKKLGRGKKSLAFHLTFQPKQEHTTDAWTDAHIDHISKTLARDFGAKLRDQKASSGSVL